MSTRDKSIRDEARAILGAAKEQAVKRDAEKMREMLGAEKQPGEKIQAELLRRAEAASFRGIGRDGRIIDEIMTAHDIPPGDGPAQLFFPEDIEVMLQWAITEAREAALFELGEMMMELGKQGKPEQDIQKPPLTETKMVDSIIMRMKCQAGNPNGDETIQCDAVYSDDPEHPNHEWAQWTPFGELRAVINNPRVKGFFEPGAEYDVVVTRRQAV